MNLRATIRRNPALPFLITFAALAIALPLGMVAFPALATWLLGPP